MNVQVRSDQSWNSRTPVCTRARARTREIRLHTRRCDLTCPDRKFRKSLNPCAEPSSRRQHLGAQASLKRGRQMLHFSGFIAGCAPQGQSPGKRDIRPPGSSWGSCDAPCYNRCSPSLRPSGPVVQAFTRLISECYESLSRGNPALRITSRQKHTDTKNYLQRTSSNPSVKDFLQILGNAL